METTGTVVDGATVRKYVEALEELGERKKALAEEEKGVKEAASEAGVDVKALATVVKERLADKVAEGCESREAVNGYHDLVDG